MDRDQERKILSEAKMLLVLIKSGKDQIKDYELQLNGTKENPSDWAIYKKNIVINNKEYFNVDNKTININGINFTKTITNKINYKDIVNDIILDFKINFKIKGVTLKDYEENNTKTTEAIKVVLKEI